MSFGQIYLPLYLIRSCELEFCMVSLRRSVTRGSLRDEQGRVLLCAAATTETSAGESQARISVHWDSPALHRPYAGLRQSP